MFKIRNLLSKWLFTIIFLTHLVKCSCAAHKPSRIELNFHKFKQINIDFFIINRTMGFYYKDSSRNDEECLTELNAIGSGVKTLELWAIKRKLFRFF